MPCVSSFISGEYLECLTPLIIHANNNPQLHTTSGRISEVDLHSAYTIYHTCTTPSGTWVHTHTHTHTHLNFILPTSSSFPTFSDAHVLINIYSHPTQLTYRYIRACLSNTRDVSDIHRDIGESGSVHLIHTHWVTPHTKLIGSRTLWHTHLPYTYIPHHKWVSLFHSLPKSAHFYTHIRFPLNQRLHLQARAYLLPVYITSVN